MTSAITSVLLADAMHAARARKASDVHLVPSLPPVLRVDGRLQPWHGPALNRDDLSQLTRTFLTESECEELERVGDVTTMAESESVPMRVHAARVNDGNAFALRFLARDVPRLDDLDIPAAFSELVKAQAGLIVLGGPTGSGKSTSLAALVGAINRSASRKVITIEDPIEYRISSERSIVVQRQIGRDVESFPLAIMGALRSDPDVIVIGEIRDGATVSAAITAAETGHLVLATLHTGDAPQSIDRLVDSFPADRREYARGRIAHVLLGAVSQRLVPRANGSGRCLAADVLMGTDAVRHLIRDGKNHQLASVMATGRRFGMQTLEAHLSELTSAGVITAEAADTAIR